MRRLGGVLSGRMATAAAMTGVGVAAITASAVLQSSGSSSNSSHSDSAQADTQERNLQEFVRRAPVRRTAINAVTGSEPPWEASEDHPVLVGIAGGTGSGKTTVAESISKRLQSHGDRVVHISHDNYYRPLAHLPLEERSQTNFDHPDALDTGLMVQQLMELKAGRAVRVPTCARSPAAWACCTGLISRPCCAALLRRPALHCALPCVAFFSVPRRLRAVRVRRRLCDALTRRGDSGEGAGARGDCRGHPDLCASAAARAAGH